MPGPCTIVMYHYVRELAETRFPRIRGLNTSRFRAQIEYMRRFYQFVTVDDCLEALAGARTLPRNAALLSFDDGYSDHFNNVFPILRASGIQGCFFPPVCAVRDGRVLDVNKIHFVLAVVDDTKELVREVFAELDCLRANGHSIESNESLYGRLAKAEFFDGPEVIFIKRLLQRELDDEQRKMVVDRLFRRHVTDDEPAFARELYMSAAQLRHMAEHGMVIGSHGSSHRWMNTMDSADQRREIGESIEFLKEIRAVNGAWVISYPYGAHNDSLRAICAELGCGMALTTRFDIAEMLPCNALDLPRLDTNHLPSVADAPPNDWTQRVKE